MPLDRFFAKTTMKAMIDAEETPVHLEPVSASFLVAGTEVYRQHCAFRHSVPGRMPTAAAQGMFPRPPQFFREDVKKVDDPANEVCWKVKDGIRLSGMRSFRYSFSDSDTRAVTGLLEDATALLPAAIAALDRSAAQGVVATSR